MKYPVFKYTYVHVNTDEEHTQSCTLFFNEPFALSMHSMHFFTRYLYCPFVCSSLTFNYIVLSHHIQTVEVNEANNR